MSIEGIFACLLRYFTAVVSIALVLAVPTTATADLITLKLPGITGDVTVEGQQGTIEVLSLSGPLSKNEWVGSGESVLWARSRAGEARRSEPLTAITGPDNRALLNAGMVRHSA